MQLSSGGSAVAYPGTVGPALSQLFGSPGDILIQHEDCLFLNVWTPGLDHRARPVMVWLHGGGHNYGSGSWPAYDGHNLARHHDVVVVTVNHRLNTFGYLAVGNEPGVAANVGDLDLAAALEWVRDNIAEFGGNPDQVMIFGQSGGGSKVSSCLIMPAAEGLVHRAAIQSGGGLSAIELDTAQETGERIARALGHRPGDLEKLQAVPAEHLLAAAVQVGGRLGPVADGSVLPRAPFTPSAPEMTSAVPLLIGYTKDERTLYNVGAPWWGSLTDEALTSKVEEAHGTKAQALIEAARRGYPDYSNDYVYTTVTNAHLYRAPTIAERKAAQRGASVWFYRFDWEAPVDEGILRAPHTIEIPFVFHNVDKGPLLLGDTPATRTLQRRVSQAWVNFARTGDPNHADLPEWRPYDVDTRSAMLFDVHAQMTQDPDAELRQILRQ
jgi:para-nitrobenzyl esterase